MIAYGASLVTTVVVMLHFGAAQPALLYIVPGVVGATMAQAALRGEWRALWDYKNRDWDEEDENGAKGDA